MHATIVPRLSGLYYQHVAFSSHPQKRLVLTQATLSSLSLVIFLECAVAHQHPAFLSQHAVPRVAIVQSDMRFSLILIESSTALKNVVFEQYRQMHSI